MQPAAEIPPAPSGSAALRQAVTDLIGPNIYEGFDASIYELELGMIHGATRPIFENIIRHYKPQSIIEVGSWNGASALNMARLLKQFSPGATLVCVDTWLGSHHGLWQEPNLRAQLHVKHGYPQQYFQFLANVVNSGQTDIILPLPMTSTAAARYFQHKKLQVDCIYIDASHEEEEVWNDLVNYWDLVRPGGVYFGDDYFDTCPGCIRSVNRFAYEKGLYLQTNEKKWFVQKPA